MVMPATIQLQCQLRYKAFPGTQEKNIQLILTHLELKNIQKTLISHTLNIRTINKQKKSITIQRA